MCKTPVLEADGVAGTTMNTTWVPSKNDCKGCRQCIPITALQFLIILQEIGSYSDQQLLFPKQLSKVPAMSRVSLLLVALFCLECCYSAAIPRPFDPRLSDDVILTPKKRPFCNAFTGCGRKRSQATPGMPMNEVVRQRQFVDEDTIGSLIDSDNAIDELSRQILSEAKLWEAIQDASAEIARRKQKEIYN